MYTQEDIRQSGQPTVAGFLNTLAVVSLSVDPGSLKTGNAVTGVRLHGLPFGTTLVLVDGRRVSVSAAAAFQNMFDLKNIPLDAGERIEVLPQGSSAIYGSDAIAGVVNIILKKSIVRTLLRACLGVQRWSGMKIGASSSFASGCGNNASSAALKPAGSMKAALPHQP